MSPIYFYIALPLLYDLQFVKSKKDKPAEGEDDEKDDPEGSGGDSGDSNNYQEEPPEGGDDNDNTGNPNISKSALDHATKTYAVQICATTWPFEQRGG